MEDTAQDVPTGAIPTEEGTGKPIFPQANIIAVRAFANVLSSTVGPLSSDTMIISQLETRAEPDNPADPPTNELTLTGDGAAILRDLPSEHPITPIVVRMIGPERKGETDVEGKDIPDGIATAVVFLGSLLAGAEDLIERGLHPYAIRRGFVRANRVALDALSGAARPLESFDDPDAAARSVARSAMTGNDIGGYADTWARLAAEAATQVGAPTEETFAVRQISKGAIADSRLIRGAVLDVNSRVSDRMPVRVEDANVLVLGGYKRALQDPETKTEEGTIDPDSLDDVAAIDEVYADRRAEIVQQIESLDVDVVVARLGISDEYAQMLADRDIVGIRRVNRLDLRQVALATGAGIVKDPASIKAADVGHAGVVEEVMREPRRNRRKNRFMTVFEGCRDPDSVVMVLHGVTDQLADQATTEVRKATAAVAAALGEGDTPGVVPGGGAIELQLADAVRSAATGESSRAQLAMDVFADALEEIPATLATNAGADRIETLADLRAAHADGHSDAGFVLPDGEVTSATDAGVLDPVAVKRQILIKATEVADLVLNIDDTIDATFSEDPAGPDDAIYDEEAEKHMDYLEHNERTRWDE